MALGGPRVLITGASGVVGHAIAHRLEGCQLTCMVKSGSMMSVPDGAVVLRGDVGTDGLGLPAEQYAHVVAHTDIVVHSAARTDWGLPEDAYQETNVGGAQRVAALAAEAGASVVLLSTAFVPAADPDNPLRLRRENLVRNYLESKRRSEQIFREAGQPLSIHRPTNLVGDAATGSSTRKQIVHHLSEWLVRGRLPYLPAHPGNLIDILPVSTVADAVAGCVRQDRFDQDYWLTAGVAGLTVEDVLEVCLEASRLRGLPPRPIPRIDPSQIPPEDLEGSRGAAAVLRVLADVSEVIAGCGGVLPSSMAALEAQFGIEMPDLKGSYLRSLEFWSSTGALA
jgi:nucleoside-diphosphate-sugar epimerase